MSRKKLVGPAELRAEAARKGITRRALANRTGLSYDYVKKLFSGERTSVERMQQLMKIIQAGGNDAEEKKSA